MVLVPDAVHLGPLLFCWRTDPSRSRIYAKVFIELVANENAVTRGVASEFLAADAFDRAVSVAIKSVQMYSVR